MDPWHDEILISSFSYYMDERETGKIKKNVEYNENKLFSGNSDSEMSWGKLMIYDVLTTKPREAIGQFFNRRL